PYEQTRVYILFMKHRLYALKHSIIKHQMIQSSVKRSYHRKNRAYVIMGKVFFRRRLSVTTLQNGCALLYHRTCDFIFWNCSCCRIDAWHFIVWRASCWFIFHVLANDWELLSCCLVCDDRLYCAG